MSDPPPPIVVGRWPLGEVRGALRGVSRPPEWQEHADHPGVAGGLLPAGPRGNLARAHDPWRRRFGDLHDSVLGSIQVVSVG